MSHYRLHYIEGLRPKHNKYSEQFKLQVLSHENSEQVSSHQVAAIYGIRNPTKSWYRNASSMKAAWRPSGSGSQTTPV